MLGTSSQQGIDTLQIARVALFPRMLVGGATGRPSRGECTLSVYRTGALHCFKCTWSVYRSGALHCTVSNVAVADGRDSNERHATKGTLA